MTEPTVLAVIGGILGIIVAALTIRKMVLGIVDGRIRTKAEEVVKAELAEPLLELRQVTEALNNGIKSRVEEHTETLKAQDEKLDQALAGQVHMSGRLDALFDLVLQQR